MASRDILLSTGALYLLPEIDECKCIIYSHSNDGPDYHKGFPIQKFIILRFYRDSEIIMHPL